MTPAAIMAALWDSGATVRLAPDGQNLTAPAGCLTHEQRALVLANKPALVAFLRAAHDTTAALIEAAMCACDHHGDGESARQEMRADCQATPPLLRADLLVHFKETYKDKTHD